MDLFQKTCFKKRSNMPVAPNHWVTTNLYKDNVFQLSKRMKKNIFIKSSCINDINT